jgi:hypothetical protein
MTATPADEWVLGGQVPLGAFDLDSPVRKAHLLAVNLIVAPRFGFPLLETVAAAPALPPTYIAQVEAASTMIEGYCNRMLAALLPNGIAATTQARRLISALRDNADTAVRGNTLGTQLQDINDAAFAAEATLAGIDDVRTYLMDKVAVSSAFTFTIMSKLLVMTMAFESKIVAATTFATQEQAQLMLVQMRDAFAAAKDVGINELDVMAYQVLTTLGGAVVNHLAVVELQLPRLMNYSTTQSMPSLYLSNRIYNGDATRSDEIEVENGIVHPAFCPTTLRVLSNAGRTNRT